MFTDTYKLKEWLKESSLHFKDTKDFSKKVRDYYNGDQLDGFIKRVLANRGQPEQFENQIAKHNNSILGFKKERQIDIKLFGRQQRDKSSADMLNAILKAITQVNEYEDEQDRLDDELSIEGVSVAELTIRASKEYDEFGREHKDIEIKAISEREVFLDPFSKSTNYNDDARYLHRCFWIDTEDLEGLGFPNDEIKKLTTANYLSDMVDDDMYTDENIRKRVLLTYTWYRKYDNKTKQDKFYYCFWSDNVILLQGVSPYEFVGFPYEVEFLNRDFSGAIKYWGLYRNIMPIQDNINYAKLRLWNMIANNKTAINRSAIVDEDIEQFNEEWSLDNATVMVEDVNGIKEVNQKVQQQQILNMIMDSRNVITDLLNSNKEMLGNANNRMSGVGQEQRIQTGLVGLNKFMGKSDSLQKRIVRKMVSLIGQYYDTQRVVSIVDEDYAQDFITMNEAVLDENGNNVLEILPNGNVKPIVSNKIDIGKFDIIYIAKPKSNSMSAERLRQNVELLKVLQSTNPELVKYLIPDILKDSESSSAKKIKDIIEQTEAQKQNSPEAQMQQQMQQQQISDDREYKISQTKLNNAKAKAMIDKNKIDLQKAFSSGVIAKENIKVKQQQNALNSMKGVK